MSRFDCTYCKNSIRVPSFVRHSLPCPGCQRTVELPDDFVRDSEDVDRLTRPGKRRYAYDDDDDDTSRPKRKKRKKRRRRLVRRRTMKDEADSLFEAARLGYGILMFGMAAATVGLAIGSFFLDYSRWWVTGLAWGALCAKLGYEAIKDE